MVENVITSRVDIQGYENIKQLKDAITALRSEMKGLEAGTEQYRQTADKLVQAEYDLKQAMTNQKKDNSALQGSYNDLVNQMGALKKVWRETTDEATRADYGAQINALNTQLKQLDATTGNYQRNVGDYKNQLKAAKAELATMTKGTAEYNAQLAKCAQIQHDFTEQQTLIKNSAADLGDQLDNVTKIGSGMASGFAALNAAMGLFGKDSEDVQKALLKVQQTMALVQGLEGLDGMWKKCEQLSTALGLVKATTIETAVATTAEATASATAGAAMNAETVATEGATVAQRGLNAAMKANPIGVIIAAVMALIAIFVSLKDKFKELINSNDETAQKFDKLKSILSGVGEVIKKFVMLPIKDTITLMKTLGKTMAAVFKGEWGKIKDIVKEGAEELKRNTNEAINAYRDGYNEKLEKLDEERARKKAEQDAKDLQETIKNNEAKLGSDWKYTQEGKKAYDAYLKAKINSYEKDTEEYKQAIRDKDSYEREYTNRQAAAQKKVAEEREKYLDQVKTDWENMMENSVRTETEKTRDRIVKMVRIWNKEMKKLGISSYELGVYATAWWKAIDRGFVEPLEENFPIDKIGGEVRDRFIEVLRSEAIGALKDEWLSGMKEIDNESKKFADQQRTTFENSYTQLGTTMEGELGFEKTLFENRESYLVQYKNKLGELIDSLKDKAPRDEIDLIDALFQDIVEQSNRELLENENDYYKKRSEIRMSYLQKDIDKNAEWRDEQIKDNELLYAYYESTVSKYGFKAANVYEVEKEMIEANYQTQKTAKEHMIENLYEVLATNQLVWEDQKTVLDQINQYEMELEDLQLEHTIETNNLRQESNERYLNTVKDSIQGTADLFGKWADGYKMVIDARVAEGKMSEQQAKKEFENVKSLQIAQATVNMLSAAIGAYQSLASIPYVGPVLGAAAAATALAYGGAQIAQIKATQYGSSSSSNGSTQAPTQVTPAISDYEPTRVTNITGASEMENLANALQTTPIWVSVTDINNAQVKVTQKDKETSF